MSGRDLDLSALRALVAQGGEVHVEPGRTESTLVSSLAKTLGVAAVFTVVSTADATGPDASRDFRGGPEPVTTASIRPDSPLMETRSASMPGWKLRDRKAAAARERTTGPAVRANVTVPPPNLGKALEAEVAATRSQPLPVFASPRPTSALTLPGWAASFMRDPNLLRLAFREPVLSFDGVKVARSVGLAVVEAARATGADPVVMLAIADKESSLDPSAAASTSSAVGLYQFIESTWLVMMRDYGAKHGLADEAASITGYRGGPAGVADPAVKRRILDLRHDPKLSALMACEMHLANRTALSRALGAEPSHSQSYLAHFLGVGGAETLIRGAARGRTGAAVLPKAAGANRSVFYGGGRRGGALPAAEVRDRIGAQIDKRVHRYRTAEERLDDAEPVEVAAGPAFR